MNVQKCTVSYLWSLWEWGIENYIIKYNLNNNSMPLPFRLHLFAQFIALIMICKVRMNAISINSSNTFFGFEMGKKCFRFSLKFFVWFHPFSISFEMRKFTCLYSAYGHEIIHGNKHLLLTLLMQTCFTFFSLDDKWVWIEQLPSEISI